MADWSGSASPLSKSDVTALVNKRFGHLGDDAIELVTQLALSPRRMRNFLTRLNLDPDRDLAEQLDVLFFYLVRQTDLRTFLIRVRFELANDLREQPKSGHDALDASGKAQNPSAASTQKAMPGSDEVTSEKATPPQDADELPLKGVHRPKVTPFAGVMELSPEELEKVRSVGGTVPSMPSGSQDAASQPAEEIAPEVAAVSEVDPVQEAELVSEIEALPETDRPIISDPNYYGPCRRVGPACRRSNHERRNRVDSIMSNRRYGGDRRKNPGGRRKTDPPR